MKDGWTALMYAAMNGFESVVSYLGLEGEANVNILDRHGRNALHWACRNNNNRVVEKLLTLKCEYNKQDMEENEPLQICNLYDCI